MKFVNVALICCTVLLEIQVIVTVFRQRSCPNIELLNGKVRIRSRGRVAKFRCDPTYQMVGNRTATCIRGTWDSELPLCIKNDCPPITRNSSNGNWLEDYKGASYTLICNPGYKLHGVRVIYCHNKKWSNSVPYCDEIHTSCNFESEDLCGWTHDMHHNFNWTRYNFHTPSSHLQTGPSYDHTFGEGHDGHYMYVESSSPQMANDTARLFSPIYEPQLSEEACFIFWYHMYGMTTGYLNVYQKLQSSNTDMTRIFQKSGEQGNQWFMGYANLTTMNQQFQIVIEAVRGTSYTGDMAIDDIKLTHGQECFNVSAKSVNQHTTEITVTSPPMATETSIMVPKTARAYPPFFTTPLPASTSWFPPTQSTPATITTLTQQNVRGNSKDNSSEIFKTHKTIYTIPYNARDSFPSHHTGVTQSINVSNSNSSTGYHKITPSMPFPRSISTKNVIYQTTWLTTLMHSPAVTAPRTTKENVVSTRHNTVRPISHTKQSSTLPKYTFTNNTFTASNAPIEVSTYPQRNQLHLTFSQSFIFPSLEPPVKHTNTRNNIPKYTYSTTTYTKYNTRHNIFPIQKLTTLKNGFISPFIQENRSTLATSTVLKESKAEPNVSHLPSIAGAAGGIAAVAIVAALAVFILSRRITRFKKQRDMSEDSDVRFLTSDEVLDFTLARPSDDDDL